MTSEPRSRRIGTRMQEELAEILLRQVSDPRLEGLIVTGIDVDRELAFATIHVTMAEAEAQKDVMTALIRARGFFGANWRGEFRCDHSLGCDFAGTPRRSEGRGSRNCSLL